MDLHAMVSNAQLHRDDRAYLPEEYMHRDIWLTLDFASAFLSPGVNSLAELVPSPRAYSRNSAPRRWPWDNSSNSY
jgi:hypothetical protein